MRPKRPADRIHDPESQGAMPLDIPPPRTPRPNGAVPGSSSPWQKPALRQRLGTSGTFVVCVELVTSRGVITERSGRRVMRLARGLAEHPRVDALSITDNPGGNAMLGADVLGTDLIARGQEVIIHLSCKDWNRNALQSRGWELASNGFDNILALSGDCPNSGFAGQARGVFDLDSVGLLDMCAQMNRGLQVGSAAAKPRSMQPTRFFLGAVVNNYKRYEREVMPQYFKLHKKVAAGAHFIINQLGYDSSKQDELLRYMARTGLNVPVLANVYVLSARAARYFHAGRIPGCFVSDKLLELTDKRSVGPDRGKQFFLEFAARQVAVARGLGFNGTYIGGHLAYEDYARIFQITDTFAANDWRSFASQIQFNHDDEFYFFQRDPDTGLCLDRVNPAYLASKKPEALAAQRRRVPMGYKLNRRIHATIFQRGSAGFAAAKRFYTRLARSSTRLQKAAHRTEYAMKVLSFDCRDCGDCALPDIAYLCPESQCAKNQRNGPCGGTRDGQCEVGEKPCIWALAYERLKAYGQEEQMLKGPVINQDAALRGTSAWANTFLGRDHHARCEAPPGPDNPSVPR